MTSDSFTIIGGGLVGLATAWRILQRAPKSKVVLLEKEAGVGRHQSTHNSGVLHCGLHYRPGSHKARLAVAGIRQMVEAGADIAGIVLSRVDVKKHARYGYADSGYYQGYYRKYYVN